MPEDLLAEVPENGEAYWTAFWRLHRGRTYAGGMIPVPNPLPYSEIAGYAQANGLDLDDMVTLVQGLDAVWLEMQANRLRRRQDALVAQQKKQERRAAQ